jgi:hypothetical protein
MSEKMITITEKEYNSLIYDSKVLKVLRDFGIEKWDKYKDVLEFEKAMDDYQDFYEEEEL